MSLPISMHNEKIEKPLKAKNSILASRGILILSKWIFSWLSFEVKGDFVFGHIFFLKNQKQNEMTKMSLEVKKSN